MATHIVIPARYASTRLPGKPLADIAGAPMIVRVMERASRAGCASLTAAVDDARVAQAVTDAGYDAVMTAHDHESGSDRVMEVAQRRDWPDHDVVINVQGDEPLIPHEAIALLAEHMADCPELPLATLSERIAAAADLANPNVVKVVVARTGEALYFSRAPIPYPRDAGLDGVDPGQIQARRHIGIYAFRVGALRTFTLLRDSHLERTEKLEQLRWLEAGHRMDVLDSPVNIPGGVDTPEDLARVRAHFEPSRA